MSLSKNSPASGTFDRLVSAAQGGSKESLGELLDQWRDYLLLVANRELGDDLCQKAGASDVVQDTFTRAHQAFGSFHGRSEDELIGWLRQILLHQIVGLRRHYSDTLKRDIRREQSLSCNRKLKDFVESLPAEDGCPSRHAMANEDMVLVGRALESLPDDHRQVIYLRYWENLSFPEIGERMGRSAEAARKCWFRAVQKLQRNGACKNGQP